MTKVRTLADFKAAHDPNVIVPNRIRVALASLAKEGVEAWEYEGEFLKRAGISQTQLGQFREHFLAHIVEAPGTRARTGRRVWFGDVKTAKKLRV